ncbi:hypothetical protein GCM10027287_14930 [Bordetella muralis]
MVDAIEACRSTGKTLELLDLIKPSALDTFIADNEILDPESADGFLDPIAARGLRKRWMQGKAWWQQRVQR